MPLPDNLLNPIPGPNPSGENLRYSPILEKIKEARREEDDAPQGEWQREVKKADYPLVVRLATDALTSKSKDLQIASWLTEALLRRDGFPGLKEGLNLLRGLLENFWDTVYPELEDGDAELRATPLEWVASRLDEPAKRVPLTGSGFDWFRYKESRAVGYEGDVSGNESKQKAREAAIEDGKLTPEEFDEALKATGKAFYEQLMVHLDGSFDSLQLLDDVCNQKFGTVAPNFGKLRTTLEEVKQTVKVLLEKKRQQEPDVQRPAEAVTTEPEAVREEERQPVVAVGAAPGATRAPARKLVEEEPADREDAVRSIVAVARYLRREEPSSPVPYLMVRGLRWGELRATGSNLDPAQLEAPPTELRQQLKRLAVDGQWQQVLEVAETVMGMPCGRAWLDLQRYVVKACGELGSEYDSIAAAIRSELKALLADFPQLPQMALTDDTPTANAETQAWLGEQVSLPQPEMEKVTPSISMRDREEAPQDSETAVPDAHELAMQAARAGRAEEAIEILTREAAQERSGRARFQRRIELAGVCMATGYEAVAYPILQDLANEIERRKLDEWEAADVVAHPLTLLFRCIAKLDRNSEEKQRVYARICRLDPVQALACSK